MRGVAETNKMLRAQELEDLRPKFELTQKDKDKEEELAKKDKEEEEKLKENDTEELIAPIDKDSAEVKPEYKRTYIPQTLGRQCAAPAPTPLAGTVLRPRHAPWRYH